MGHEHGDETRSAHELSCTDQIIDVREDLVETPVIVLEVVGDRPQGLAYPPADLDANATGPRLEGAPLEAPAAAFGT